MLYLVLSGLLIAFLAFLWLAPGSARTNRKRKASARPSLARSTATKARGELSAVPATVPAGSTHGSPDAGSITAPVLHLLDDDVLAPEVALQLTNLADALPRPRSVMLQLVQAGDDPVEVARVVATDPATAALLLRTVNSAQFNLSREITSVQHAITFLGANLVRDIALHHSMAVPVDTRNLTAERIYHGLWRNSYLASGIALALAQRLRLPSPSVLATQALLFRLGDIALVSHHPEMAGLYHADPDLIAMVDQTQRQLGFNSAMIGAHLAQVWGLPPQLRTLLRRSLAPLVGGPQTIAPDIVPGVALGFFSTRLAQALSRQVDVDVPGAVQALGDRAEAHYLPQYLTAIRLDDVPAVLAEPAVERRLARLMGGSGR
nr:J555 [uncultured bacterium]